MAHFAVLVDSRGGNTRKVAYAIAEELGTTLGDITAPVPPDAAVLFLGSGTYGGKPGNAMMSFIRTGDFAGRRVALFGTSGRDADGTKMIAAMAGALREKGAIVLGSFDTRGRVFVINLGRPHADDLENARKFAREMVAAP